MLNGLFVFVVLSSILLAAWGGQMQALTDALLTDARRAVTIALELVGVMALFLGLMRVAEEAGLSRLLARAVSPLLCRLFPAVPPGHPAMGAMVLNIASNALGLANAATPFGIKAMEELDRLNGRKGTATNAMVLFLAINTSGLALMPASVVALRAAAGSADAAGILVPTWIASACATVAGVLAALALSRLGPYRASEPPAVLPTGSEAPLAIQAEAGEPRTIGWRRAVSLLFALLFLALLVRQALLSARGEAPFELVRGLMSHWILPALVAAPLLFGWSRGIRVYDALVEGAKEGFAVALRILPYLVAILVAVGLFRASGGMSLLVGLLDPVTSLVGMPAEVLPMAILRPLSGSGAMGVMVDAMKTHGPDSLIGYMVSTIQGSTETTFYVLAVYFGAVSVKRTRHALPACLAADVVGILAAVLVVSALFGRV